MPSAMAIARRTESMIALRAAQTAVRIARDVGYPHIDLDRVFCERCGCELDWRVAGPSYAVACSDCHHVQQLPSHLRGGVLTAGESQPDYEYDWKLRYFYQPMALPESEDLSAPLWLHVFLGICLIIVGVLIAIVGLKLH